MLSPKASEFGHDNPYLARAHKRMRRGDLNVCRMFRLTQFNFLLYAVFFSTWLFAAICDYAELIALGAESPKEVSVSIEPDRKLPAAGTDLLVTVKIVNMTTLPIFVDLNDVKLLYPSALSPIIGGSKCTYATTEARVNPGFSIRAQCNSTPEQAKSQFQLEQLWSDVKFLSFKPDQYILTAVGRYTTNLSDPAMWRNFDESSTISIVAPQSILLFGASLGGLFAYLLFTKTAADKKIRHRFGAALSTMLFSVVVTILLSRITETQFFVKVNVNDLWGAIAVGFVASYLGKGVLDRLVSAVPPPPSPPPSPPPPPSK